MKSKDARKVAKARMAILASLAALSCLAFTSLLVVSCAAAHKAQRAAEADKDSDEKEERVTDEAELPRVFLKVAAAQSSGRKMVVANGSDLQAALDSAKPGDTVALEPGAIFTGNFVLPQKSGKDWITIRPSNESVIPPAGSRVNPAVHAAQMPKIITPNRSAALRTDAGAHHYRIIGIELGVAEGVTANSGILLLGDGTAAQNSLEQVPHDLIVERCYIHGNAGGNMRRGVALNSASTTITDSYITQIHEVGADTQAIGGWNGPGPFRIINNYLEAAGENVMFGGADPKIANLVPSDIEFRRNHCFKPLSWREGDPAYAGTRWTVKNLFELKNAQRVLVDGNVFENSWAAAQQGKAILLKSVNQDGTAPWSVTQDVTFTNNIVRHAAIAVDILGQDSHHPVEQARRIKIANNLFEDIDAERWGGGSLGGYFLTISNAADVKVDHNTVINSGGPIYVYVTPSGSQVQKFTFTNNITNIGTRGLKGDGSQPGTPTLDTYFTRYKFKKNLLVGGQRPNYPKKNFFPASLDEVGFVDARGGNYSLGASSPYRDAGCDISALSEATSGVVAAR
jgi:hypothetical protein